MPKRTKRTSSQDVHNLIVISDTHCGCRLGLCPPGGVPLDDGGSYELGTTQRFLWHHWKRFWDEWVPSVTHGEPFSVLHNGDALDGVPHQATTPVSTNPEDQQEIAYRCLAPVVDACQGRYYHIRGTEAHVGKSSVSEERLAKRLGAIPNKAGQFSHYDIWKRVGDGLVHAAHHIGVTSSTHHEASAVNAELTKMYVEAARWGNQAPQIVVRSHRHSYCEVLIGALPPAGVSVAATHRARVLVTPAWQGKTPFAWRVARGRPPQFGGVLIRHNGTVLYTEVYVVALSAVEVF